MTTRPTVERGVEEDLTNVGVPPKDIQAPSTDNKVHPKVQALVIPPPMTNKEIRGSFLTFA